MQCMCYWLHLSCEDYCNCRETESFEEDVKCQFNDDVWKYNTIVQNRKYTFWYGPFLVSFIYHAYNVMH